MTRPPIIVFDLDGTLVDTRPDLVAALNAVLATEGLPPATDDAVTSMVGHGARVLLTSAMERHGITPDSDRLDNLVALYIDRYSEHIADESRPYPGVIAALDRFRAAGWLLAVCTNKLEGLSRQLLEALGMTDRFAAIAGADTFGVRKPDPRHLLETIRVAGGDWQNAVMVGDSIVDVDTAKAAGIPVVAVTFGYSTIPVEDLGADATISAYPELDKVVYGLKRPLAAAAT